MAKNVIKSDKIWGKKKNKKSNIATYLHGKISACCGNQTIFFFYALSRVGNDANNLSLAWKVVCLHKNMIYKTNQNGD